MNYEDFKNELVDVVKEELADRGHNVNVQINTVEKMNESYEAMTVTPEGSNIGMNINITALGKAHENGTGFDEIVDRTVDMVENHLGNMPQIDVETLTDYEQMKEKLAMEVVSAERNAPEIRPAVIKGMSEVMMDMMGPEAAEMFGVDAFPENELMYVATVPDKTSGAGVIAYQEFMDQAAEKLGGDFFILPSSVHEILLVKDDGNADYKDLKA